MDRTDRQHFIFRDRTQEPEFAQRNQSLLKHMGRIEESLTKVFGAPIPTGFENLVIHSLGRSCGAAFSSVAILSSNGYGFAAMQILRSMVEKHIDALYLAQDSSRVTDFWDFHLVQLKKQDRIAFLDRNWPDWRTTIQKFRYPPDAAGKRRWYRRWSGLNLVDQAVRTGAPHLTTINPISNSFIHTSVAELLAITEFREDGEVQLNDFFSPPEINSADQAFRLAWILLLDVLAFHIKFFDLGLSLTTIEELMTLAGELPTL